MNKVKHKILIETLTDEDRFIDDRLDILFEDIDNWLCDGDFQTVNNFLSSFPVEKSNINVLVAIMTIIHNASDKLTSYHNFSKRFKTYCEKNISIERAENILNGLLADVELNDEVVKKLDPIKKYIFYNTYDDKIHYGYYKCKIDGCYRIETGQNHEWVTHVNLKQ